MEEEVFFYSGGYRLEGLYAPGRGPRGAVVCHPHPLYGGDMRNPVVAVIADAFRQMGCATLRFNFRGAGRSQGNFDEGRGELADIRAAAAWMAGKGPRSIDRAGYSFGAWVNALAGADPSATGRMVMVSPPVAFMDFSAVGRLPDLALVVTGDADEIAPAEDIRRLLHGWNPDARFEVITGADHLYSGGLERLAALLVECLDMS
jgi:alpha/beta superfamily hydrolase